MQAEAQSTVSESLHRMNTSWVFVLIFFSEIRIERGPNATNRRMRLLQALVTDRFDTVSALQNKTHKINTARPPRRPTPAPPPRSQGRRQAAAHPGSASPASSPARAALPRPQNNPHPPPPPYHHRCPAVTPGAAARPRTARLPGQGGAGAACPFPACP